MQPNQPTTIKWRSRLFRAVVALALVLGAGSFVMARSASALTVTDLRVSGSPDRSASVALNGATTSGNAYIYVNPTGVQRVSFWLDNPTMSTTALRVDTSAPFDFVGNTSIGTALPWASTAVADGVHSITARVRNTNGTSSVVTAQFTVRNATVATTNIFGSEVPSVASANDVQAVELGVKFRVAAAAQATGVRFYKGATNTGSHLGRVWSSSGQLLANATFTGESASGWQQVTFASPIALQANTTYVASVYMPVGGYSYSMNAFATQGAGNSTVQALANGADGVNGVYRYVSGGGFPNLGFNATNYFVDVTVTASSSPVTPTTTTAPPTTTTVPPTTTTVPPTTTTTAPSSGFVVRNATNTGVPAGTVLTPSGSITVTVDNTVLSGLDVNGCITVNAKNVTIKNTRVRCNGYYPIRADGGSNTLIQDVTIDGMGSSTPTAVYGDSYTVLRANIFGVGDGPRAGSNVTVQDSYIHDLVVANGSHNDGIQSTGGSNIVIRGNNIQHPGQGNATLMLTPTFGPLSNVLVENNLLNGGAFTVHAGGDPTEAATTNVVFRNNRFGRDYLYGIKSFGVGDISWTNNTWFDTGVIIP